ncbi:insulinase family protein [Thioflexithrix psekupsensis]|uniref:Peptidase M16 n=1 Tax=Thioflexithrix psekupsensis TaxID=1570016 RepID=A0A251XAB3_9GAMM|nr:insulinase family protein [Thioflexithrix psekupsensis]OUD15372.1 peptidase M16 [Thioflexithrix psekupsensis]
MTPSGFICLRTHHIENLKLQFEEYRHQATGAIHYHLAGEDENNVFLVAFLTVPEDSTGIAHILEHTTLCGSQRYPVRDPFFMMTRRSLNTFMNAFTGSDWTAYPFASQNVKDFDNLLRVYLDAVFFPLLDPLDIAQEGCRLEFETPDDSHAPLVYRGVVFNEMKGAMSSSSQVLSQKLNEALFPTITYHYNSGGDPEIIPQLTPSQLKAFHASHYHPSNAIFMTYGCLPASHHQALFQECVLTHFHALPHRIFVPNEQRFSSPQVVHARYAVDKPELARKTHLVTAWLLNEITDARAVLNVQLLSDILLDNSASPLRYALESCEFADSPSSLCGFDDSTHEIFFSCGLEGTDAEYLTAFETLVNDVLMDVVEHGVPQEQVESVLHQMELQQREITGDGMPYGLHVLFNALVPALHGADPIPFLDIDPLLQALREDCQRPDFIPQLVKDLLLNNAHRVTLVMSPDPDLAQQQLQAEKEKLAQLKAQLSPAERQAIIEQAAILKARQEKIDNPDILPKVTVDDIPDTLKLPESYQRDILHYPATWFAQGTNGLVYQTIIMQLPQLPPELVDLLPIYCEFITELGCAGESYLDTAARQAAVTGGLNARLSVRCGVDDVQQTHLFFALEGKALARHQADLSQLLHDTLMSVRFDELERLQELMVQLRSSIDSHLTHRGHQLAMTAAASGFSAAAAWHHRWNGIPHVYLVRELEQNMANKTALIHFSQQLAAIHELLLNAPRQFLIISEEEHHAPIAHDLAQIWHSIPVSLTDFSPFKTIPVKQKMEKIWQLNTQVNFCAKAYPAVAIQHRDAPALTVLGDFLRNGFLHRAIREQGGAYGASASYHADAGCFRFFSFRDPLLMETLQAFDQSLIWLQNNTHNEQALEEAILGVIGRIDQPLSPSGEANSTFFAQLNGRTPEQRREFRRRVLKVTITDLQRVAMTYLQAHFASTVVLSSAHFLAEVPELTFTREVL